MRKQFVHALLTSWDHPFLKSNSVPQRNRNLILKYILCQKSFELYTPVIMTYLEDMFFPFDGARLAVSIDISIKITCAKVRWKQISFINDDDGQYMKHDLNNTCLFQ